jgi:hypothetical protein
VPLPGLHQLVTRSRYRDSPACTAEVRDARRIAPVWEDDGYMLVCNHGCSCTSHSNDLSSLTDFVGLRH